MNNGTSVKTVFCSAYKILLSESQFALRVLNERRNKIYLSGFRGKKFDDELRTLQAKYARALTQLQSHAHECPLCQLATKVVEEDSEVRADNFSDETLSK